MPEPTSPEMVTHMIASFSRLYDRYPDEVAALHDLVVEHLDRGPHGTFADGYAHVADHVKDIFPALMQDSRVDSVHGRLLAAYADLPATPETRLSQMPGENSVPWPVVAGGGVILVVVLVTIAYCLGGPSPAPGESVEARC